MAAKPLRSAESQAWRRNRNYKNWNPVLLQSLPFKNQYRSIKKTKCSLHFLQLLALPYGAVIKVKEDLVDGGEGRRVALSYCDKQCCRIQTRAFYHTYSHYKKIDLFWPTPQQDAFGQSIKNVKKYLYLLHLWYSFQMVKKTHKASYNRRRHGVLQARYF